MNHPLSRRTVVAAMAASLAGVGAAHAEETTPTAIPAGSPSASGENALSIAERKRLVAAAADAFFNQHDPSAIDRYVASTYRQHSALIGDGPEALRQLVAGLGDDVAYEAVRLLGDGDLVAAHGRYTGFGPDPLVAFDIFRVADGKLAEHWDGLQPEAAPNPSGHGQLDGPTAVTEPEQTEASRTLVEAFVDTVLIRGRFDRIAEFISGETYVQHNPQIGDGLAALGAAVETLAQQGLVLQYNARHRTVAEGEFVLIQSDGAFGRPVVFYDLFRVADGKIVEHWDVIQDIPAVVPHDNGLF